MKTHYPALGVTLPRRGREDSPDSGLRLASGLRVMQAHS